MARWAWVVDWVLVLDFDVFYPGYRVVDGAENEENAARILRISWLFLPEILVILAPSTQY